MLIKTHFIFNTYSIYIPQNSFTVKEFIKDDIMLEYLNNVFDSVRFPESVVKDIKYDLPN